MEETLKVLCRICATTTESYFELFNTTLSDSTTFASDFLSKITSLELAPSDRLSHFACAPCLQRLSDGFDLAQLAITSETHLRNQLDDFELFTIDCFEADPDPCDVKDEHKYTCEVCKLPFNNKRVFTNHTRTHRGEGESNPSHRGNLFKCQECEQTFPKKINLQVHMRAHVKNEHKKFSCKTCGKSYNYAYFLRQHEFKHSDEKPFPCTVCNRGCLTAESLRRHMTTHNKDYVRKKHSCSVCSKEFDYPSTLAEHKKCHTGERPHLCSVCGKGFRQTGALHFHQRVHTGFKPFVCEVCDGRFMSQSLLKVHMRKHTNERPFVCHVCGAAFRQSTDLNGHQRIHSGEKRVLCPICGKRMSATGQLTIHLRTHTGEKPFVCKTCPKAFTTRTLLVKHTRIHTGERPYICDVCGKAFNQSSGLKSHLKVHEKSKTLKKERKESKQKKDTDTCTYRSEELSMSKDEPESLERVSQEEYNDSDNTCLYFEKSENEEIENEIVSGEFVEEIEVKEQYIGELKGQYVVSSEAPVRFLHSL